MMSPQEEYLARHGLTDVAIIRHVDCGTVFITKDDPVRTWTILHMKWQDNAIHPGEYQLCYYEPIHNGYKAGPLFGKLDELTLQHDEYEQFIYEWATEPPGEKQAVEGEWQVILSCWEMFLSMYDSWFVENAPSSLKRMIFKSIDPDQDISARLSNYQEALLVLTDRNPNILKRFKFEVLLYAHSYCDWLAKLVNRP